MEMRIRIFTIIILMLITGLLLNFTEKISKGEAAEVAFSTGNLIRLHVVANSDGVEDQKVKLLVRDRILRETEELLAVESREEALERLAEKKGYLIQAAEDELQKYGFNYHAGLEMGEFNFPERKYEFGVLPAGQYQALRVVLGKGSGENWWCVLFPPVCHLTTEPKENLSQEKLKLRWKAWEELKEEKEKIMEKAWMEWAKYFQMATLVK